MPLLLAARPQERNEATLPYIAWVFGHSVHLLRNVANVKGKTLTKREGGGRFLDTLQKEKRVWQPNTPSTPSLGGWTLCIQRKECGDLTLIIQPSTLSM